MATQHAAEGYSVVFEKNGHARLSEKKHLVIASRLDVFARPLCGLLLSVLGVCAVSGPVAAADLPVVAPDLPFDYKIRFTGYADTAVAGDATSDNPQFSGRVDAYFKNISLWEDGHFDFHLEAVGGDNINGLGSGVILPTNLWAAYPRSSGDTNVDLNVSFTQKINPSLAFTIGKINAPDMARAAPLVGGNGEGGFLYNGISAPPPGSVLPAYTFGAMLAGSIDNWIYNFWVYDPNNAQGSSFWKNLFDDGVVMNGTLEYRTDFGGLPGFYGVNFIYSTAEGTDLDSLLLPPGSDGFARQTSGLTYTTLKFTQYLSFDPERPSEGWGIFGFLGIGDGNPGILDNSFMLGIGGTSPIDGRNKDRWGVAWARYNWSDDLIAALDELVDAELRDEWVVEAYYEAEIIEGIRLGMNLERVRPGAADADDYTQIGMRISASF